MSETYLLWKELPVTAGSLAACGIRRAWAKLLLWIKRFLMMAAGNEIPSEEAGGRDEIERNALGRKEAGRQAEKILYTYGNSILRLAYSYLHNMSDAEEILQDTLLQFLKTAPVFENSTHEKAWLLRVAGNLSKNRIEYNRLRSTDELNETLAAEEREDLSFVWEAVKSLPLKYREVIHLFYHEGYSTAEIAGILSKNEATIRSCLRRGRGKLKEILKEAYDFEETV